MDRRGTSTSAASSTRSNTATLGPDALVRASEQGSQEFLGLRSFAPPGRWDTSPYACSLEGRESGFLRKELGHAVHNHLLLFFGHLREHRQGQHVLAGFLRLGEIARAISQIGESRLQMKR